MRGQWKDYYQILGIEQTASREEIKRAFRILARKYHPDVSKLADSEARFKQVAEAYEVLKTDAQRAAYDAGYAVHNHADLTHFSADMERLLNALLASLSTPVHTYAISISQEEAVQGNARVFRLIDPEGHGKNLKIHIPPGVQDGQKLRFNVKPGNGAQGMDTVFIKIRILPVRRMAHTCPGHNTRTTIDL